MTSHLIHGLWHRDSGLHLWIEQVEGHKIVTGDDIPSGTFPPTVEAILAGKKFRHRVPTKLMTPKNRIVRLPIPTVAFAPEQAASILAQLATISATTATAEQRGTIAPDLAWLVRMYEGLEQFIKAGRVTMKMGFVDHEWWPAWQLSNGLGERGWIAQMTAAAPGVLISNSGTSVAEDMADELTHWTTNSLLSDFASQVRSTPLHDFPHALLHSQSLRRGNAQLVSALNAWKDSITAVELQLVVIVEEPPENEDEEIAASDHLWPVRVQVRSGVESPQPIKLDQVDNSTRQRLEALHRTAMFASKLLDPARELSADHPAYDLELRNRLAASDAAGIWDVYLSTAELVKFIGDDADRLRQQGINIMLPRAWSTQETKAQLVVDQGADGSTGAKIGLDQIVDYNWRISVGDTQLTDAEMEQLVRSKSGLIKLRGEWVMADTTTVKRVSEYMEAFSGKSQKKRRAELDAAMMELELAKANKNPEWQELEEHVAYLTEQFNKDFAATGEISLSELREFAVKAMADDPVEFTGNNWQASLVGGMAGVEPPAPQRLAVPPTVHAELRDYQRRGVDWLYWMSTQNLGAVLADDMGLGKTLQLLTLEAVERYSATHPDYDPFEHPGDGEPTGELRAVGAENNQVKSVQNRDASEGNPAISTKPTLVVAPTSVVGNWAREASKFVPDFRVMVHHGSSRKMGEDFLRAAADTDIVITSYGTIARDHKLLAQVEWERVVLDEAQQIKNSATKVSRAVRSLPSRHRVALTGTPVENRLSEMRSILDFCNPGVLGSASFFRNHFAKAIEREQDEVMTSRLRSLTAPFILRRLKTDTSIIGDLPEKTESILTVTMTREQAAMYKAYVDSMKEALENAKGMERRGMVLSALTKIKQICNHPAHFLGDGSSVMVKGKHRSGKVAELMRVIEEAQESGQKLLIFTQYKAFGELLTPFLSDYFGREIPFLNGGVSKTGRDKMVENFQRDDGPPAMVLSLKAGGTGLNLTAASIVVHMDRWWNPAVENQATDRAFRIGQHHDVTVYKMITAGTMEESIQDILDGKTQLASAVVGEGEGWLTELSTEELAMLMSYRDEEED